MKWMLSIFLLSFLQLCSQRQHPILDTKMIKMEHNELTKNPFYSRTEKGNLVVNNEEWKKILSPELFAIAREAGTEQPYIGKFYEFDEKGEYYCAVCGNHLFHSTTKFASSCGWPSFYEADPNGVKYRRDESHGMRRIEVLCKRCESHLGHVFNDGPKPTGTRFCMNSVSLDFVPDK